MNRTRKRGNAVTELKSCFDAILQAELEYEDFNR